MSKATIGDQGNTQSALVSILSNIKGKDLDSIKSSLHSLYTDIKLQECAPNIPEGFFPNYTNVKEYGKILRDLTHHFNKGQNLKRPCESSANKDSDSKETEEDKKKEKGPKNPKKKARWQGKKDKAK